VLLFESRFRPGLLPSILSTCVLFLFPTLPFPLFRSALSKYPRRNVNSDAFFSELPVSLSPPCPAGHCSLFPFPPPLILGPACLGMRQLSRFSPHRHRHSTTFSSVVRTTFHPPELRSSSQLPWPSVVVHLPFFACLDVRSSVSFDSVKGADVVTRVFSASPSRLQRRLPIWPREFFVSPFLFMPRVCKCTIATFRLAVFRHVRAAFTHLRGTRGPPPPKGFNAPERSIFFLFP